MTIGWATIGFAWRKPIFMVMVRNSRHTFSLIEKAADFTVSVPSGDMKKEIAFCGTKSGRDVAQVQGVQAEDRIQPRGHLADHQDFRKVHFECRIVYKNAIDPAQLAHDYDPLYPEKDYHTLYFGEIQACYEI